MGSQTNPFNFGRISERRDTVINQTGVVTKFLALVGLDGFINVFGRKLVLRPSWGPNDLANSVGCTR